MYIYICVCNYSGCHSVKTQTRLGSIFSIINTKIVNCHAGVNHQQLISKVEHKSSQCTRQAQVRTGTKQSYRVDKADIKRQTERYTINNNNARSNTGNPEKTVETLSNVSQCKTILHNG